MATRARRNWKPDPRGYYSRQIGWERSKSGKLQQHKFLLGTDRKEAERRERKLRELWDTFAANCKEDRPLWPDDLLIVAKRVAKGIPDVPIPRGPNEKQLQYAARVQRLQAKYPVLLFLPEDQHAYEVGQAALELFESVPSDSDPIPVRTMRVDKVQALKDAKQSLDEAGISSVADLALMASAARGEANEPLFGTPTPRDPAMASGPTTPQPDKRPQVPRINGTSQPEQESNTPSARLGQAFKAYQKYLRDEYHRPETEQVSPWGRTQIRQIKNLKKHHVDCLLTKLDADAVNEMIGYWRRRPCKLGTKGDSLRQANKKR